MPKLSKFVLLSPDKFYVRKQTYACTACGKSFSLDAETAEESLLTLERDHFCSIERPGCSTGNFPLMKMMRELKIEM